MSRDKQEIMMQEKIFNVAILTIHTANNELQA